MQYRYHIKLYTSLLSLLVRKSEVERKCGKNHKRFGEICIYVDFYVTPMSLTDYVIDRQDQSGILCHSKRRKREEEKVSRSKLKRPRFLRHSQKPQPTRSTALVSIWHAYFCFCKSGENIYMCLSSVFPGMLFVSSQINEIEHYQKSSCKRERSHQLEQARSIHKQQL